MGFQDIFIIGADGNVGGTLVKQVLTKGDVDSKLHLNPTRIVGLASITNYIYSPKGIPDGECFEFVKAKGKGNYKSNSSLMDILEEVIKSGKKRIVFVDVTAAKNITDFHLKVINETNYSIVTANKNPIAISNYKIFQTLTSKPGRYGFRCSVMAGAEAVIFLQDLKDVNDSPKLIQGCFSGTLGYICSELEKKRPFSEILAEAKEMGFTEPHPRDDLNGLDVARKLLILSRVAGYNIELSDVEVVPFIPKSYFDEDDVEKFIESTKELDSHFAEKDKLLRYVAEMKLVSGKPKLKVSLEEVEKNSPLGSLSGTLNKIVVVSNTYSKEAPYSVEAPGAGLEVTAQNIRRDLLHQLEERKCIN